VLFGRSWVQLLMMLSFVLVSLIRRPTPPDPARAAQPLPAPPGAAEAGLQTLS